TERRLGEEPPAARGAAIEAGHLGAGTGLVDEDELVDIDKAPRGLPDTTPRRDCQEFRAEVGHDRSKGARQCRDAKHLTFRMPSSTSCWPAPIRRRPSTLTGYSTI